MHDSKHLLTVGLLWHSMTSDNLGVGALTFGQIAIIREAAKRRGTSVQFFVIGTRGETPYPTDEFTAVAASGEFALRAFKAGNFSAVKLLRQCDIVFDIGEGDSFSDIYGTKRLSVQVFSKILTRVFGIPLILSPQTIGPFVSPTGKLLGKAGMHAAVRIYSRDHLSMDYLVKSGMGERADEVIDVAFALPFQRPERHPDEAIRVGINVSGLLQNKGYSGSNEFGLTVDYPSLIESACKQFLENPNVELTLVPHVISKSAEIEDDYRASEALLERFPKLKLAPRFRSPMEAKSFISGLDFFSGARMHACIAAYSSGVPVVPMAYSRKFNGLFHSLSYSHLIDCLKDTNEQALKILFEAFAQRTKLAADVAKGNLTAQLKLDKYTSQISDLLPLPDQHT